MPAILNKRKNHRCIRAATSAALLVVMTVFATPALAHPHVQVSVKSVVVANDAGEIIAIRHAWTFDEAFSSYATLGLDTDKDGKLSREELAPLAQVNVESLSEHGYFTFLRQGKERDKDKNAAANFDAVKDYFLTQDGKTLILNFTLPVSGPPNALKDTRFEVYDPTFFVAFEFAGDKPLEIEGAGGKCAPDLRRPKAGIVGRLSQLGESVFSSQSSGLDPADWAVTIRFTCK